MTTTIPTTTTEKHPLSDSTTTGSTTVPRDYPPCVTRYEEEEEEEEEHMMNPGCIVAPKEEQKLSTSSTTVAGITQCQNSMEPTTSQPKNDNNNNNNLASPSSSYNGSNSNNNVLFHQDTTPSEKTCENKKCATKKTPLWRKGWPNPDNGNRRVRLCNACGLHFRKGHYCKYCFEIYKDMYELEGPDPWICCTKCDKWVHKRCAQERIEGSCTQIPSRFVCSDCSVIGTDISNPGETSTAVPANHRLTVLVPPPSHHEQVVPCYRSNHDHHYAHYHHNGSQHSHPAYAHPPVSGPYHPTQATHLPPHQYPHSSYPHYAHQDVSYAPNSPHVYPSHHYHSHYQSSPYPPPSSEQYVNRRPYYPHPRSHPHYSNMTQNSSRSCPLVPSSSSMSRSTHALFRSAPSYTPSPHYYSQPPIQHQSSPYYSQPKSSPYYPSEQYETHNHHHHRSAKRKIEHTSSEQWPSVNTMTHANSFRRIPSGDDIAESPSQALKKMRFSSTPESSPQETPAYASFPHPAIHYPHQRLEDSSRTSNPPSSDILPSFSSLFNMSSSGSNSSAPPRFNDNPKRESHNQHYHNH